MKKRPKGVYMRFIISLLLLGISVACVRYTAGKIAAGFDIKQDTVAKIENGKTPQKEIIQMFGVPSTERTVDGKEQYFYEYREAMGTGVGVTTKRKTLLVMFDEKKVVEDYVYKIN